MYMLDISAAEIQDRYEKFKAENYGLTPNKKEDEDK
jgi:hypothetical protein